jgi:hypothetical protein
MVQANLKYLVEDADLRVQRAQRCLDRQREAVAALERACLDATTAKRLLTISEKAFEIYVADQVRLTRRMASPTTCSRPEPPTRSATASRRQALGTALPIETALLHGRRRAAMEPPFGMIAHRL